MGWQINKKGIRGFIPSLTIQANPQISNTLARLRPGARICDVGAGGRKITNDTFTIDGFVKEGTDLVCDIHQIPLPDESFDCIFCTGTLEHVEDPHKVVSEIRRLLKSKGIVHIEVPFIQGFHADPSDYWRWTLDGLKLFCKKGGFDEMHSGVHIGPASAVTWVINQFIVTLFNKGVIHKISDAVSRILLSPIRYLDYILIKKPRSEHIASAVYFVGRKA